MTKEGSKDLTPDGNKDTVAEERAKLVSEIKAELLEELKNTGLIFIDPNKKGRQLAVIYNSKDQYGKNIERKKDGIYISEDQHLLGFRNLVNNKDEYIKKDTIVRIELKQEK